MEYVWDENEYASGNITSVEPEMDETQRLMMMMIKQEEFTPALAWLHYANHTLMYFTSTLYIRP